MNIHQFLAKCPSVGANKRFLVVCNGKPFAGFNTQVEAKDVKEMYGKEIRLKKGLAYCSAQEWAVVPNPEYMNS